MLFWILMTFGFDKPYIAVLTFCAAMLHELGHILASVLTKVGTGGINGKLNGLRIKIPHTANYPKSLLIILAGPLTNVLVALPLLLIGDNDYIRMFGLINLLTALSNLLPVEGYDGYRLLCELGSSAGIFKINTVMKRLSFSLIIAITLLSLYLLLRLGVGYWLFAVFFTSMISKSAEAENSRKGRI